MPRHVMPAWPDHPRAAQPRQALLSRFDDFTRRVHFLPFGCYPMHTGLEREALTRDPTRRDDAAAA